MSAFRNDTNNVKEFPSSAAKDAKIVFASISFNVVLAH
jgi:hypothetical protein